MILRHAFRAMGTDVELLLDAGPGPDALGALRGAADEFERLEALFSRFRPDSELTRLNESGALQGPPEFVECVELALEGRARTAGRFDPTVHDALVASGYDRSFEHVAADGAAVGTGVQCGGRVVVDHDTGLIVLESGFRLDLGGIAKGYAADRACAMLAELGACLVNAGGDIALSPGRVWPVGVATGSGQITVELENGALATSGVDRRRWRRGGRELHHLIDPATGLPATTDLVRVTVVAGNAVEAEIRAKQLFLAGADAAVELADADRLPCVLVQTDGATRLAGGLA